MLRKPRENIAKRGLSHRSVIQGVAAFPCSHKDLYMVIRRKLF